MLNLLRLELYKLKKQKTFLTLFIAVIIIAAFRALSPDSIETAGGALSSGKASYAFAYQDICIIFISAAFAGFFIGSDFADRTVQLSLSHGHSRINVILSKAIFFFICTSVFMVLYSVTISAISTLQFGWGEAFTLSSMRYVLRVAVLGIILNIGTASVFVLIAFQCRDIPKTLYLSLAYPLLFFTAASIIGDAVPAAGKILAYTTQMQLFHIAADTIQPSAVMTMLLSSGITVSIFLSLNYCLFSKAEVK